MQGALRSCKAGVLLDVAVTPSADRESFPDGYNEWRGRVGARVRAPAEDGEANRALCELVAERLDVDPDRVGLRNGHTSPRKTLVVQGVTVDEVGARIEEVVEG